MKQGQYIVIDGIDGGGKGSLFLALEKEFPLFIDGVHQFVYTREPGGTPAGEEVRKVIIGYPVVALSEFFLFLAQRNEVRRQVVEPALHRGVSVISDRSDSSTFAYQIRGRQYPNLEKYFWEFRPLLAPLPTLYIFLDLDPKVALSRLKGREGGGQKGDRFDSENIDFFSRVRRGFVEFSEKAGTPSFFVDASQSKEVVAQKVIEIIRLHIS